MKLIYRQNTAMSEVPGQVLRAYRERLQLSQQEFASLLGVSQSLISIVEVGRGPVSRKLLRIMREQGEAGALRPAFGDFLNEGTVDRSVLEPDFGVARPIQLEPWAARINLSKPADPSAAERIWVPGIVSGARAFRFTPSPPAMIPDTVGVFRPVSIRELGREQIVLIQLHSRTRSRELVAGAAHVGRAIITRARGDITFQFEPSTPTAPILELPENAIVHLMLCIFRGRYAGR
jgi:transcriptional regulator with XRE-family HTH domain